jgi:hypothetical protein
MIDLDSLDRHLVINYLTPRQVMAEANAVSQHHGGRDVLKFLMQTAINLTAMGCKLSEAYTEDRFTAGNPITTQPGLGPNRHAVLAAAATCAHNAALFLQEAQRWPAHRAPGYDPLIVA